MKNNPATNNFIQQNSPDGGFLQSDEWAQFQKKVGRKIFSVKKEGFWANIVEHQLPIVGKYFYVPRGPVLEILNFKFEILNETQKLNDQISKQMQAVVNLAKKNKAGWIRVEPATQDVLEEIRKNTPCKIVKAPHDMQPKELFIIDITKTEAELLQEMKSKTRYNIRLAEKKGVSVLASREKKVVDRFCELVEITAKRQGIVSHEKSYYEKMIAAIPEENSKIFYAEFEGKIIAANLVLFFGRTATYLHGASDDDFRNVMAPYLLQWRQMQAAKVFGAEKYDFGGIKNSSTDSSWAGITRFKQSFSPETQAMVFPGSYDIIINKFNYKAYRIMQKIKCIL